MSVNYRITGKLLLALLVLTVASCRSAAENEDCELGDGDLLALELSEGDATAPTAAVDLEAAVWTIVTGGGKHVVTVDKTPAPTMDILDGRTDLTFTEITLNAAAESMSSPRRTDNRIQIEAPDFLVASSADTGVPFLQSSISRTPAVWIFDEDGQILFTAHGTRLGGEALRVLLPGRDAS